MYVYMYKGIASIVDFLKKYLGSLLWVVRLRDKRTSLLQTRKRVYVTCSRDGSMAYVTIIRVLVLKNAVYN